MRFFSVASVEKFQKMAPIASMIKEAQKWNICENISPMQMASHVVFALHKCNARAMYQLSRQMGFAKANAIAAFFFLLSLFGLCLYAAFMQTVTFNNIPFFSQSNRIYFYLFCTRRFFVVVVVATGNMFTHERATISTVGTQCTYMLNEMPTKIHMNVKHIVCPC